MQWHGSLKLLCSNDPPTSASQVAGTTGDCHHTYIIFLLFVRTGSHQVAQTGLKLLDLNDLPGSTFQNTGITGVSPCVQPTPGFQYISQSLPCPVMPSYQLQFHKCPSSVRLLAADGYMKSIFFLFFILFLWTESCSCHPAWNAMVQSRLTATSASRDQASQIAGITGTHH